MGLPTNRLTAVACLLGAFVVLSPKSAWAQGCPSATLDDCENPAYFSTPCGEEEWSKYHADEDWVCKSVFDHLSATAGPAETVVEPEVMVDRDGNEHPRSALTRTVARQPVDYSSFVERDDFALSGAPVLQLDPRIQYRRNGEAFNSCDEMVFESYRSYEEWYRSTRF